MAAQDVANTLTIHTGSVLVQLNEERVRIHNGFVGIGTDVTSSNSEVI